jgi:hypothetical protein
MNRFSSFVTPAQAGAQMASLARSIARSWIPAFAGMTALFSTPAHAAGSGGTPAWAMLAYLASGVFFILALRGLSSPATSRSGNRNGMIGMGIALVTTLVTHNLANFVEIGIALAIGGVIGVVVARRIAMTAMPVLRMVVSKKSFTSTVAPRSSKVAVASASAPSSSLAMPKAKSAAVLAKLRRITSCGSSRLMVN